MEELQIDQQVTDEHDEVGLTSNDEVISPEIVEQAKSLVPARILRPGCIDNKNMFARLFGAGFTHEEIAAHFGVSRIAVTKMVKRMGLERKLVDPLEFQNRLQDEILIRMENIMRSITPDKMNNASLSQLIMAFGILYDKMRLGRGESTSNVASLNIHKIDPGDLTKIKEVIRKHTAQKLQKVHETYEETDQIEARA